MNMLLILRNEQFLFKTSRTIVSSKIEIYYFNVICQKKKKYKHIINLIFFKSDIKSYPVIVVRKSIICLTIII